MGSLVLQPTPILVAHNGEFDIRVWCPPLSPLLAPSWPPLGPLLAPFGPLLFSLVMNILVSEIASDAGCAHLLYHAWYLDDGVVAGPSTEVRRVLAILEERGPSLGPKPIPTTNNAVPPTQL